MGTMRPNRSCRRSKRLHEAARGRAKADLGQRSAKVAGKQGDVSGGGHLGERENQTTRNPETKAPN